jgi:hypothetical protein
MFCRDLKGEANRIRVFDHTTTPYYSRPKRPIDYQKIDADVLTAVKYLRSAPFAIQKARLRQDTGIFVSDGAVPESLHREVGGFCDEIFVDSTHLFYIAPDGIEWARWC